MRNPVEDLVSDLMSLGGRPRGDPDAIFRQAQALDQLANRLSGAATLFAAQAPIPYYEGPQAVDYEIEVREQVSVLRGLAQSMQSHAGTLFGASARLASDQVAWDQGFQRRVAGVPSSIVDQAQRMLRRPL